MSENISKLLREWVSAKSFQMVSFQENDSPANDPSDDYSVKYEARFKPARLEQAEVEIVLTSDDFIGIGFATRANVARRLNIKNSRRGYAAGFEPCEKKRRAVAPFFESCI